MICKKCGHPVWCHPERNNSHCDCYDYRVIEIQDIVKNGAIEGGKRSIVQYGYKCRCDIMKNDVKAAKTKKGFNKVFVPDPNRKLGQSVLYVGEAYDVLKQMRDS